MKDSQLHEVKNAVYTKYIKANNERFSTSRKRDRQTAISISRRIMKDSQPPEDVLQDAGKYIKANNERFSTKLHRT